MSCFWSFQGGRLWGIAPSENSNAVLLENGQWKQYFVALSKRSVHHHPFHFLVNAKLHNQITPADLGESQRKRGMVVVSHRKCVKSLKHGSYFDDWLFSSTITILLQHEEKKKIDKTTNFQVTTVVKTQSLLGTFKCAGSSKWLVFLVVQKR